SPAVYTNTLGPGSYVLYVDSADGTAGAYTLTATLGPGAPVLVQGLAVSNVTAPGPMSVSFEVRDANGFVVITDNSTMFTVNVTGSATFTGASKGTLVSGSGTNSALVRVAAGVVTLSVSDATPQTV